MAILRGAAWVFLVCAVVLLTNDLTRATTGRQTIQDAALTTTLSHWKTASPATLTATANFVQSRLHPKLWNSVLLRILLLPAWALLAALGVLMAILGRRKRRINIFAN